MMSAAVASYSLQHCNNTSSSSNKASPFAFSDTTSLERALTLEAKHRGYAQPSLPSATTGITSGMRDGSAHVLRCLKVWYDLPSDVFFGAMASIDRFLSKMRAQPKHLSCIAVSAFHLSCRHYFQNDVDALIPDPADLVTISQSRCSPSDLLRMQGILASKLDLLQDQEPVTTLSMLRVMYTLCRDAAIAMGLPEMMPSAKVPDHLIQQLEILTCDSLTLAHRPSEVCLALLANEFQRPPHQASLMVFIRELQFLSDSTMASFLNCVNVVSGQLERYNGDGTVAHRQRLVWKLSNRTLRHLRPTDKLRPTLPTIKENVNMPRLRSNSECSEESMASLSESDSEREMEEY